jgi:Ca2+-binding EF-hand superfamily protein
VRAFDTRGKQKLNLQEFTRLHTFLTSIQATFVYFDRDRSQTLQSSEVIAALKHAGFTLDQPVVDSLLARHHGAKGLQLDEFIRL